MVAWDFVSKGITTLSEGLLTSEDDNVVFRHDYFDLFLYDVVWCCHELPLQNSLVEVACSLAAARCRRRPVETSLRLHMTTTCYHQDVEPFLHVDRE
jgi:hypothetical protein